MRTKQEIETAFAPRSALGAHRSFFLVGIGGAGMSGLARMLKHRGHRVKGTDLKPSPVVDGLREDGIEVWVGHSGGFVEPGDAVVLTDAIDLATSPEVAAARSLGCDLFRRSQVLGWMLEGKKTIAVTGTHGKTTTTGMIGAGLRANGLDPTIVVGAEVPEFGGAIVEGTGEWAVVEACEAYDSLRDFDPAIVVLTNLELDHVDFHGSWEGLKHTVKSFVERLGDRPDGGVLLYCADDRGSSEIGNEVAHAQGCFTVDFYSLEPYPDHPFPPVPPLSLPGRHNQLNALGALCAVKEAGGDVGTAADAIAAYRGAERRLQVLEDGDVTVVDDYAHHPTEIVASLQAVRERWATGGRRLVVVFQPHLYSRTTPLVREFAEALDSADLVVLTDIFPAREDPVPGVSSFRIAELVTKPCSYVPQRHLLPRQVAALVKPGDVVVGMGAGNISDFAPALVEELRRAGRAGRTRVAVVYGGDSAEREVSILSGREVLEALRSKGHDAFLVDVSEALLSQGAVKEFAGRDRPDVCFLAVHGTNAEDGAVQGLLELLHLPYTGSGIQSSAIAMDKNLTKLVLEREGLPVPKGVLLDKGDSLPEGFAETGWVVKPNAQGSTVGLSFVQDASGLARAIEKAFQFGDQVLVEEWVRGTEVSVPVLGDRPLPVVEIVPASGAYDFESKYTPGATTEICPARITPEQTTAAQELALRAHRALGCSGATRTDMIVTDKGIVCLEVNTLPGMTATSLVPRSALAAGISFEDLCDWMVKDALARAAAKAV